jgi:hypothetical protein
MTATYPEPPDGSIVGWGTPIHSCYVRIDEYAEVDTPLQRWFPPDDAADLVDGPATWEQICSDWPGPYLLTPTPLKETHA